MALASSEVSFRALASNLGAAEEVIKKLIDKGIKCMADYAHSTTYVFGQSHLGRSKGPTRVQVEEAIV